MQSLAIAISIKGAEDKPNTSSPKSAPETSFLDVLKSQDSSYSIPKSEPQKVESPTQRNESQKPAREESIDSRSGSTTDLRSTDQSAETKDAEAASEKNQAGKTESSDSTKESSEESGENQEARAENLKEGKLKTKESRIEKDELRELPHKAKDLDTKIKPSIEWMDLSAKNSDFKFKHKAESQAISFSEQKHSDKLNQTHFKSEKVKTQAPELDQFAAKVNQGVQAKDTQTNTRTKEFAEKFSGLEKSRPEREAEVVKRQSSDTKKESVQKEPVSITVDAERWTITREKPATNFNGSQEQKGQKSFGEKSRVESNTRVPHEATFIESKPAPIDVQLKPSLDVKSTLHDLVDKARLHVKDDGSSSASLRLKPEHLGSVTLNLKLTGNQFEARLVVESEAIKKSIKEEIDHLKSELKAQGFQVDKIEISVREPQQTDSQYSWNLDQRSANQRSPDQQRSDQSRGEFSNSISDSLIPSTEITELAQLSQNHDGLVNIAV